MQARCEVDAAAASQAASTGLVGDKDEEPKDPVKVVGKLIKLTLKASWIKIKLKLKKAKKKCLQIFSKLLNMRY